MNINKENIEAYLLDYAEGTLSVQQKKEVESFLALNPEFREMLSLYDDSIKLEEEPIIFTGKEDLKHAVILPWKKIVYTLSSLAAVALLLLGLFRFDFTSEPMKTNSIVVNPVISKTPVANIVEEIDETMPQTKTASSQPIKQESVSDSQRQETTSTPSQQETIEPIHHTPEIESNLLAENTSTQEVSNTNKMDTIIIIRSATERPETFVDKMERYVGERTVNNIARTVGFVQNVTRGAKEIKKSFKF
ncbi:MAG: hypothetical protein KBT03_01480 [Bacteroidales bacterium]|nr:hypothetical protein [Candidatus Scybalousia scybalohippi]